MSTSSLQWLTPEIEAVQAYHRARVTALYAGRLPRSVPLHRRPHVRQVARPLGHEFHRHPQEWLAEVLANAAAHASDLADRATFHPLVIEADPLGVHYIDALLGANVYIYEEQTWNEELPIDLAELTMPDLAASDVFQRSVRLARLAVDGARQRAQPDHKEHGGTDQDRLSVRSSRGCSPP